MKSQANGLLKVAEGVLTDYSLAYPSDKAEVSRDIERLTRLVKERGLSVFLLDLPALDGPLLRGLESGRLILGCALSKRASAKILVPRLFRGLWLRIFDRFGNLLECADPTCIFFLRQLLCLGKKVEVVCSPARTQSVLKEYYHVERDTRSPSLYWGYDDLGSDDSISFDDLFDHRSGDGRSLQLEFWREPNSGEEDIRIRTALRRLQRNCDAFSEAIGKFEVEEFLSSIRTHANGLGFRQGPGAVSDLTSKEYKYDFPTWSDKLGATFPFNRYGSITDAFVENLSDEDDQRAFVFDPTRESVGEGERGNSRMVCPILSSQTEQESEASRSEPSGEILDPLDRTSAAGYRPSLHEPCSRLLAVPKTAKGPRLIAAEPTAHQWCQQFVKRFLEERLTGLFGENFISFRNQGLSQRLVSKASLDRSLATVDLSSASDRLSCWVVERAFRANPSLLRALHATRTRWTMDAVDKTVSPNYFVTKKFASQGTAVTFPVQSIIFFLVAISASGFEARGPEDFFCNNRFYKPIARYRNKVRVFGDDIILPVHGYELLAKMLHVLGLKVNLEKSFSQGHFRESCGMDCFKGHNVTPIKTTKLEATGPQSRQSLIDYANNLHQAGLWHASKAVESITPGRVLSNLPVVGVGCGGVGRVSYTGNKVDHLRKRWNTELHRFEYRVHATISRVRRKPTNTLSGLLQYFAEAPSATDKWSHGVPGRPKISDGLRWEPLYG